MNLSFFRAALLTMCALVANAGEVSAATCPANVGATATPTSDFVVNANGTVLHTPTGLIWKQCNEGKSGAACATGAAAYMTWANALTTARASTFAGYTDWRLPNKQELESLVDDTCYAPAINDTVFSGTVAGQTWTSTSFAAGPAYAWYVGFGGGGSSYFGIGVNATYAVRLVRGGQSFDGLATACNLDMDGDTRPTATKERLVLLRASLGLTGAATTTGTGITDAQWATARPLINANCGTKFPPVGTVSATAACNLDMDGDALITASKEWLVLMRASLGFTGAATTAGIGISAAQWATARPLINANCGTNFGP